MSGEPISLDELLTRQGGAGARATLDEVPDQPDRVQVTPFTPDAGCLCDHAFTVPRDAIASVTPTGETHDCCGKTLLVVTLTFADPVLNDVYQQLNASIGKMTHERPAAWARTAPYRSPDPATTAPPWWSGPPRHGTGPEPRYYYCEFEHRYCVRDCDRLYRPGTLPHRRCVQRCDDALDECNRPHPHLRSCGC